MRIKSWCGSGGDIYVSHHEALGLLGGIDIPFSVFGVKKLYCTGGPRTVALRAQRTLLRWYLRWKSRAPVEFFLEYGRIYQLIIHHVAQVRVQELSSAHVAFLVLVPSFRAWSR